jgi:CBS domain-containing protein
MQVSEIMTANVECARPDSSLLDAARKMKKLDIGSLPVCGDDDKLTGIVTDRDIVIRAVADGRDLEETKVRDIMTPDIIFCTDKHPVEHAARLMNQSQVRRLVVLNDQQRMVGILSLGDLAVDARDEQVAGDALEGISEPAAPRR